MQTIDDFLTHFRRQRGWTITLVRAVPDSVFDWAPAADTFSCGGLVRHLIQSESFWRKLVLAFAAGEEFDPFHLPGSPRERLAAFRAPNVQSSGMDRLGKTFAECLTSWEAVTAKTERELTAITSEQLHQVIGEHPLTGMKAPLWEMLFAMIEHEAHHRGQLSAYLKVLGIPQPPFFGLDPEPGLAASTPS